MESVLIKRNSKELKMFNEILDEAFADQRIETSKLLSNKYIKNYVFKDNNKEIGLVTVCESADYLYLFYLAVNKKLRNKGYGSIILKELKKLYKDKQIIIDLELIDSRCDNNDQRIRRRDFYIRNGYKFTGIGITYFKTHNYEIVSDKAKVSVDKLNEVLTNFKLLKEYELYTIDKMFHVKQYINPHKIGVIFDFNGTLYDDNDINDEVWDKIIKKSSGIKNIDVQEIFRRCGNSKNGNFVRNYMKYLNNKKLSYKEAEEISVQKENLYFKNCKRNKMNKLTKGTKELTDYLYKNKIPYSIATMAPTMNVDFYYSYTDIKDLFNSKFIICDIPKYKRKNEMFIDAAKMMNVDLKNIIVIEDSPASILQAKEAGINKFIYRNSRNKKCDIKTIQEVKSLKEINKNLIK